MCIISNFTINADYFYFININVGISNMVVKWSFGIFVPCVNWMSPSNFSSQAGLSTMDWNWFWGSIWLYISQVCFSITRHLWIPRCWHCIYCDLLKKVCFTIVRQSTVSTLWCVYEQKKILLQNIFRPTVLSQCNQTDLKELWFRSEKWPSLGSNYLGKSQGQVIWWHAMAKKNET